jgi:hypothetical protein
MTERDRLLIICLGACLGELPVIGFIVLSFAGINYSLLVESITGQIRVLTLLLESARKNLEPPAYLQLENLVILAITYIIDSHEMMLKKSRMQKMGFYLLSRFYPRILKEFYLACQHPLIREKINRDRFLFEVIGLEEGS